MKRTKTIVLLVSLAIAPSTRGVVRTGLDNIGRYRHLFEGRRIGVIANHTARDSAGRFIVDIFRQSHAGRLTALFSPEHGFTGTLEAGRKVADAVDPDLQLPVYSLYGRTRKPTEQMLADVDVLVFDIQDVGARFYTYIYTMSLAMQAAARTGTVFVVLDRPNPINGLAVEGNVLDPNFASFVGMHPIPVRHAMTVAELAQMFNEQGWAAGQDRVELHVVPMTGWRREMWYDQTGLTFTKPSPNIPNLATAIVYPGLCLLEGTNVSEGRGTPLPFRQFGAPWIEPQRLLPELKRLNLPGLTFLSAAFTPSSSKYEARKCRGVRIHISDRSAVEAYWSGIMIVRTIHRMYPTAFEWRAEHFDRLCGTDTIRRAIVAGAPLDKLRAQWRSERKAFRNIRNNYLLYPD